MSNLALHLTELLQADNLRKWGKKAKLAQKCTIPFYKENLSCSTCQVMTEPVLTHACACIRCLQRWKIPSFCVLVLQHERFLQTSEQNQPTQDYGNLGSWICIQKLIFSSTKHRQMPLMNMKVRDNGMSKNQLFGNNNAAISIHSRRRSFINWL